ncbi:MAG: hypothetical protein JNL70_18640 [Saprospiraceae bacterium]|nr:hypothetical protein [Saprospiraceae bacterium]
MTATHQKHVYLKDLHFEHRLWLNELSFAKDELGIFANRLSEVEMKNTVPEFTATAESLQNRLYRQQEVVDDLRHAIKKQEANLAHFAEEHPIAVDHVYFDDHTELRDQMARFTPLYAEFKAEFMRFIAKWM